MANSLWGDEVPRIQRKSEVAGKSGNPQKSMDNQKAEEFRRDHIDDLDENSTPKAWLIKYHQIQDELKRFRIIHSEMKDLREYVDKTEKRCNSSLHNVSEHLTNLDEDYRKLKSTVDDFVTRVEKFMFELVEAINEGDQDGN